MKDWTTHDHYIEHNSKPWRVNKTRARSGTKEFMVYRAWIRGSGKWSDIPGTFNSAAEAIQQLENK